MDKIVEKSYFRTKYKSTFSQIINKPGRKEDQSDLLFFLQYTLMKTEEKMCFTTGKGYYLRADLDSPVVLKGLGQEIDWSFVVIHRYCRSRSKEGSRYV